jgi:poly-gamma-glutamate synthesis protein (capsule biosynthesis protein)
VLGRGVNRIIHEFGPGYPFEPLHSVLDPADLFFVNLESAISPRDIQYAGPPKAFYFRANPIAVEALTAAHVDFVSLANNHALDADVAGLRDTLGILERNRIQHAGAGETLEQASAAALLEMKGQRFGVLAFCDHQSDFAAGPGRPGIRYTDLAERDVAAELAGEIHSLASQVDHVIVSFHWQPNWVPHVLPLYRDLARRLIEAGARVVWGHSPHHFQGVEWIGQSIALFSTGDLLDDYALNPEFRNDRQLLFQLTLSDRGVESVRAYPLQLEFGRTHLADTIGWAWIVDRFEDSCDEVDSHVEQADEFLTVHRGPKPDPEAARELKEVAGE